MNSEAVAKQPEYLTADGTIFEPEASYWFWDSEKARIRKSDSLRRVRGWLLDELDREIVPLGQLHRSRDAAIEAGQKAILRSIESLRDMISTLEGEKTPGARTMKYTLMARN